MKIAFVANQGNCISGKSNGIRMQALIWKECLEKKGYSVDLVNAWDAYNWEKYDVIHFFGGGNVLDLIPELYKRNHNIFVSPIIDSNKSAFSYKIASFWGCEKLRLFSSSYKLRRIKNFVKGFFVRSNYEAQFLLKSYGVDSSKVYLVPLSYRTVGPYEENFRKENFCLHVSSFTQSRKNVMRLVDAAIKYDFRLVLAGSYGTEESFTPFKRKIDNSPNIEYVGFATDEKLIDLYKRAKVFALPSTYEGVGLVALEAAVFGDEIVITNVGGPKEYYSDLAYFVNPYSVEEIGTSVLSAMKGGFQPKLKEHIEQNYNLETCISKLIEFYKI